MDFFDRAQELEMLQRESNIAEARKAKPAGPEFTGECHHCGEARLFPWRFCDADCREGWEREDAARKRRGTVEDPTDRN